MDTSEIKPGLTYIGGKSEERRTVIQWGSSLEFVVWSPTINRLPYGGFAHGIRCTTRKSFAKWAKSLDLENGK